MGSQDVTLSAPVPGPPRPLKTPAIAERERIVQEIQVARSQPQNIALEAMRKRLFGKHPYGLVFPDPPVVAKTGRAAVRRVHTERVQPRDATLVVVGDVRPAQALDRAD